MGSIQNSILVLVVLFTVLSCTSKKGADKVNLSVIASSDKDWTGIAISRESRMFVNYPKWSDNVPVSVAEIVGGKPVAYPNLKWNSRKEEEAFVAVQSVVIDDKNRLWILDTRNPQFRGVNKGGPKLFQFNLETDSKENVYSFPQGVFQPDSYFNDVRIDTEYEIAYITDSGNGALVVLDLKTGNSRRLLDQHISTQSEVDYLVCDGIKWENTVHSDGIALTPDKQFLYYIALTGHTLYRVSTKALNNDTLKDNELAPKVEKVCTIPATDGMMFDKEGNLWLGGLEDNSINLLKKDGTLEKVVKDDIIRWADSFAFDKEGNVYFTTSQIHLPINQRKEYQVIKLSR
ncbi:L-dopachrome tautomerase-related protein [uncultured Draconibacterium sp.]|uniref:SMP-30/gluconolactonase/LRE family protein n=1 Tax=uncultured Draconibacterium sp. TaxID=1573823 RepID=UPI0029C0FF21|nr:L-dopachrome tautomerase-related protein [uncultured Draconibacterium sp.]